MPRTKPGKGNRTMYVPQDAQRVWEEGTALAAQTGYSSMSAFIIELIRRELEANRDVHPMATPTALERIAMCEKKIEYMASLRRIDWKDKI